jgi:hypothetical protein
MMPSSAEIDKNQQVKSFETQDELSLKLTGNDEVTSLTFGVCEKNPPYDKLNNNVR